MRTYSAYILFLVLASCNLPEGREKEIGDTLSIKADTTAAEPDNTRTDITSTPAYDYNANPQNIHTGDTRPEEVISFAKTLVNVPYKYASIDPHEGFDCSGFITYVFNHFKIAVPRSSKGFTNVQREVEINEAKPGDLILFTGTDSTNPVVGHMGIIIGKENGELQFIHSSSGKANGVTVTPLQDYYMSRFVKVVRIFKQNDAA